MVANIDLKTAVLKQISEEGHTPTFVGKDKWRIAGSRVHVRYRSGPKAKGAVYSYNINPNTLSVDFELWICGDASRYYLLPIVQMRRIYDDPDTYVDKRHPEIRVAEVDLASHRVLFGSGGKSFDGTRYYCKAMKDFG